ERLREQEFAHCQEHVPEETQSFELAQRLSNCRLIGGSTDHGHTGPVSPRQVGPDGAVDRASLIFIEFLELFGQLPIEYMSRITALRRSSARTGCGIVPRRSNPLCGHQDYNPKKFGRPSHVYHSYMLANLRLVLDVEVVRAAPASRNRASGRTRHRPRLKSQVVFAASLRWSLYCKESRLVAPRSSSITPRIVVSIKPSLSDPVNNVTVPMRVKRSGRAIARELAFPRSVPGRGHRTPLEFDAANRA